MPGSGLVVNRLPIETEPLRAAQPQQLLQQLAAQQLVPPHAAMAQAQPPPPPNNTSWMTQLQGGSPAGLAPAAPPVAPPLPAGPVWTPIITEGPEWPSRLEEPMLPPRSLAPVALPVHRGQPGGLGGMDVGGNFAQAPAACTALTAATRTGAGLGNTMGANAADTGQQQFVFEAHLLKPDGARLGIDVLPVTIAEFAGLSVLNVSKGGVVDAWNQYQNKTHMCIRQGDTLMSVNDTQGDINKMMEELRMQPELKLLVLRRPQPQAQPPPPPPPPAIEPGPTGLQGPAVPAQQVQQATAYTRQLQSVTAPQAAVRPSELEERLREQRERAERCSAGRRARPKAGRPSRSRPNSGMRSTALA